jgi:hypothetical protein
MFRIKNLRPEFFFLAAESEFVWKQKAFPERKACLGERNDGGLSRVPAITLPALHTGQVDAV